MDEELKEMVRGPVIRPEDLAELLDKTKIPSDGIDLTILDVWGGRTKYGYQYKISTAQGDFYLNKASLKNLAKVYGNNTALWRGKGVHLQVTKVNVRGEMKDSIIAEPLEPLE